MAAQTDDSVPRSKPSSFEKLSVEAGRKLCNPPPGDDVVITGIAGKFPDSDGVYQLRDNLFNKVDMVSGDYRRWKPFHPEIPQRTGKLFNIEKFDAGFYGIRQMLAGNMDPMLRMLFESTFEAIIDAGYHPSELAGSNTGVFLSCCFSESEQIHLHNATPNSNAMSGNIRTMAANRLSYYFKLSGPSFSGDAACSSAIYGFEHAYRAIRNGVCDRAIVAASGLCLIPNISLQFFRLGACSANGISKSFDNDADGYARSEGINVILLEKSTHARRIYAHVVHAKTNCDGYKEEGITFPSSDAQQMLLKDFYTECGVGPSKLMYIEAHGTGTKVGDPVELNTIDKVFCGGRDKPLYIGSIKSNIGHNEPVAGLSAITKVLIAMESGFIPPNINFNNYREGIEAFEKGMLKVVTDKMAWPDNTGLAGVNCFGFGGANGHVLLRWNNKIKTNQMASNDKLPRLICVSGRTSEAVEAILDDVRGRQLDVEHVKLLHTIFGKEFTGHLFRGYSIVGKNGEIGRGFAANVAIKKPICLMFASFDNTWYKVGNQLESVPIFAATLQKIADILFAETNIDIMKIVRSSHKETLSNEIVGTVAVQIGIVDMLKALMIVPDFLVGTATGNLLAAYFEDYLTLKEVVLASVYIASVISKKRVNSLRDQINDLEKIFSGKREHNSRKYLHLKTPSKSGRYIKQGSAEHFLQSSLYPIALKDANKSLPLDALGVLIGPNVNNDMQSKYLHLIQTHSTDFVKSLFHNLGCLFNYGCNMELDKLYANVQWPVSKGTPMISPLIRWNHDEDYYVLHHTNKNNTNIISRTSEVNPQFDEWKFVTGHVIDGRNLFPATGYLYLAWEALSTLTGKLMSQMRVCFKNIKFVRATRIPTKGVLELTATVQNVTQHFEITENGIVVVHGQIYEADDSDDPFTNIPQPNCDDELKMNEKDIYKELKLRGYNYTGKFRGLKSCDVGTTKGTIEWSNSWIAFMDCMLQMEILKLDSRNLYVPTSIQKVTIDAKNFDKLADELIPVFYSSEANMLRSEHVEIIGTAAASISRRKLAEPVLETYKFLPNNGKFPREQSLRVLMQIILENTHSISIKTVEIDDDSHPEPLSPIILKALGDVPLIQPEIIILSEKEFDLPGVVVKNEDLNTENGAILVIASDIFGQAKDLTNLSNVVKDKSGFVITRENSNFDVWKIRNDHMQTLCIHATETETLILMRVATENQQPIIVDVTDKAQSCSWLPELQTATQSNRRVVVYAQGTFTSGILGLVNCLRREPSGDRVACVFIYDDAPKFDPNSPFYKDQLSKKLAINVWKDSSWGTYRHLLLDDLEVVENEHCFANVMIRGDLSSLMWVEGWLTAHSVVGTDKSLVHIYYAAINFKDIMLASGRIAADTANRRELECVIGFEYSGRDLNGRRVMGMTTSGALSTMVAADVHLQVPIPERWSMEEAATVPVVYWTVIYALLVRAQLKFGQSILIHSGTGGIGQAAINIALHYRCTIFTTVGTQEKRDFMNAHFPQIKNSHIGNSRDTSFEQMIQEQTEGRGVDIVLNSLAEEKLEASVRCLGTGGKFLEIGKFDLANNNALRIQIFSKQATFEGIMLDKISAAAPGIKKELIAHLKKCIDDGAVKPLSRTVFKDSELEQAFRFMSSGKHIGKVLIRIRQEENEKLCPVPCRMFKGIPRFCCDPEGTYVILGGLGGFGLELADWLIIRGAKKLVLTSRAGVKSGYQLFRLRIWKTYGTNILVRTDDASTTESCVKLLQVANSLGPVKAIFNLAVVLKDALFNNGSVEDYEISLNPKAIATKHLDDYSRKMCPHLEQFVVFSSVSCGRGNAGQTNYGMSNSIMERICEQRTRDGLPSLAIQWGAIGDVGLVAEMQNDDNEIAIGGTLPQKISNCLQLLDKFIRQKEPIISSMVVAEKRTRTSGASSIVDVALNILGINDVKTISAHSTFPELGMDSMMAVEMKQTLEREYEVFLSPQDMRAMTIAKLEQIANTTINPVESSQGNVNELPTDILLMLRHIGVEAISNIPVVQLKSSVNQNETAPRVYMLPGLEGMALTLESLAENLKAHTLCLQFCTSDSSDTIQSMARSVLEQMEAAENFMLIAYSFGCVVATELIHLLEQKGRRGKVIFIDGSCDLISQILKVHLRVDSDAQFQTSILCAIMNRYMPIEVITKHKLEILKCKTLEERFMYAVGVSPDVKLSTNYLKEIFQAIYTRLNAANNYSATYDKFKSKVKLIKPTNPIIMTSSDDYNLSKWFSDVDVDTFEGDHSTILENPKVAEEINKYFGYV